MAKFNINLNKGCECNLSCPFKVWSIYGEWCLFIGPICSLSSVDLSCVESASAVGQWIGVNGAA